MKMEENNEQTAVTRVNNKLALTSFVLSLVGLIIAGIPCGIAALITGIMGLTKFDQEKEKNKWMAIVGIIVSVLLTDGKFTFLDVSESTVGKLTLFLLFIAVLIL